jgi:hypothetical protein
MTVVEMMIVDMAGDSLKKTVNTCRGCNMTGKTSQFYANSKQCYVSRELMDSKHEMKKKQM